MPKNSSVSSIRTLWENNPDTPLTAANLSRLQDLTASYLNTDVIGQGIHVEGSLFFIDPINSSQILLKRGTIVQIINESVDMLGEPIIPTNSQYRVFDIGLEDIILTWADTDETNINKTTWGSGTNEWFIFICDKDDSVIYNKNFPDAYGGGAQILISKNNDYPQGQVPGRPTSNYSAGDTRLLGGFKTSNDIIITSSIWDIAGKFNKVKARTYYILDEYAVGGVEYRQIELRDINTSVANTLNNNLTVNGTLSANNVNVDNINAKSVTLFGTLSQTGPVSITGNTAISGSTTLNTVAATSSAFSGTMTINDASLVLKKAGVTAISFNPVSAITTLNTATTNNGLFTVVGNVTVTGNIAHTGNAAFGGSGKTLSLTGASTFTGATSVVGDFMVKTSTNSLFNINQTTQVATFDLASLVINAPLELSGGLVLNSGSDNIVFSTTHDIISSTGGGYSWKHTGDFITGGGDNSFIVQQNDSNVIFKIDTIDGQITSNGVVDFIIPQGETFTIKNHLNNVIFGVEYDIISPTDKKVVVNTALNINDSNATNALNVVGNASVSGDLTVEGTLYADIQGEITGGSSKWSSPITMTFNGDVTGSTSFDGSANKTVTLQVADDSHSHDTSYYTKTQMQASGSASLHWNNISNKPTSFTAAAHGNELHSAAYITEADITFARLLTNGLVYTANAATYGVDTKLARADHLHDSRYLLVTNANGANITFTDTNGIGSTNVSGAINALWSDLTGYVKSNTPVSFTTVAGTTFTGTTFTGNGVSVLAGNTASYGVNFKNGGTTYQVWVDTSGNPKIGTKRFVTSNDANNTAPVATALVTPQTLRFSLSGGIGAAPVSGVIGNGSSTEILAELTLDSEWIYDNILVSKVVAGSGVVKTLDNAAKTISFSLNFQSGGDYGVATSVARSDHTHSAYEPVITTKGGAFNVDFGTTAGTAAEGNHTHSGYEPTITTKKTAFNVDFGTTNGTAAQGNHTHSGYALTSSTYTKAEVQAIINALIVKINAMTIDINSVGDAGGTVSTPGVNNTGLPY